ncbi:thermotolerance protein [Paramyrothecium foliicola]|nr:thermotolerance protein [Paramyrothecium foliicola]
MAFQTSVLRNGEWVTEMVDLQAALKASNAPKTRSEPQSNPPSCGLLTKTVVESPIVHWVLPVRLRSRNSNDIAFIGRNFVQISELQKTGQVQDILRKNDFDLGIRNALVFGRDLDHCLDQDIADLTERSQRSSVLLQNSQTSASDADDILKHSLPPQMLVLILESGDLVFLFIKERVDGRLEFVVSTYDGPRSVRYLGHLFAIDPSSRYMAAASPDGLLVIYEVESMEALEVQYATQGFISPVKSLRIRTIQGVIHKVEFLYPRPEDDYHIIFLLFLARKERGHSASVSRMVTYEWEVGDSLNEVFSEEKAGTRLPPEHKMPLLLVPLRFKTSFLIVSQHYIGVVKDALSGSPSFEYLPTESPERTELSHGHGEPLWTAWARPFRLKEYFQKTDVIYLAREDGAVQHIEIDTQDLLPSMTNVGFLQANIDTAFGVTFDRFSDVLIVAGDSGPGGIWKLAPRRDLERVSVIPNWSPVVDMTTNNQSMTWNFSTSPDATTTTVPPGNSGESLVPDVLFSASGRGLQGTVTEWRWGARARIGLDLDLGEPIRQAWAFFTDDNERRTLNVIIAAPHSSIVLSFSEDLDQVDAMPTEATPFDLSSTTISATQGADDSIIQITETSITKASPVGSFQASFDNIFGTDAARMQKASCSSNFAVVSCHRGMSASQLYTIEISSLEVSPTSAWEVQGEVTCLSLFKLSNTQMVAVGSTCGGVSSITLHSLSGEVLASTIFRNADRNNDQNTEESLLQPQLDALTSICVMGGETADSVHLVVGSRCGHLITMNLHGQSPVKMAWTVEKLGRAPLDVYPASGILDDAPAAFACCDNSLFMLKDLSTQGNRFNSKVLTFPTDSNDASLASPPIHSLHALRQDSSRDRHRISMLLLSESKVLLTEISSHIGPVPRSVPVDGTPTRIIYSQTYECLVVALLSDNRPTLAFVDPTSGRIISEPMDKDRNPSDFISGLGQAGDKITGLGEWLYVKDGKTFTFILVATKAGNLLIVSASVMELQKDGETVKHIQYFTRNKKRYGSPIYSIVVDGDGIIFCVDRTLHWNVLNLAEKKLKPMGYFELESPATSLQILNGKIFALTTTHSLQVIDHRSEVPGATNHSGNQMTLLHTDRVSRATMHMIDVGDSANPPDLWPISILSDMSGGITGVWVPWAQKKREFFVVFEGFLPTTVRRFMRLRGRAAQRKAKQNHRYGTLSNSIDEAEVLGVSVNGSLQQFTLISVELWRLLFLVQRLARRSSTICLFNETGEPEDSGVDMGIAMMQPHPKRMVLDGDLIERCLRHRALEELVGTGEVLTSYCRCLDQLDNGIYTESFRQEGNASVNDREETRSNYLRLGYDILEYLFAPVL